MKTRKWPREALLLAVSICTLTVALLRCELTPKDVSQPTGAAATSSNTDHQEADSSSPHVEMRTREEKLDPQDEGAVPSLERHVLAQAASDKARVARQSAVDETQEIGTTAGYFFDQGRYIAPPYRLTVVDYAVLVNGKYVLARHAPPKKPNVGLPEDPGEFRWTEEKLTKRLTVTGFAEHAWKKLEYWGSKYGFERGWEMFVDYYRNQPTVKKVKLEGKTKIVVTDVQGHSYVTGCLGGKREFEQGIERRYSATEDEAEERYKEDVARANEALEQRRKGYEERLSSGSVVFSFSPQGGAVSTVPPGMAAGVIDRIGDILRSSASEKEKLRLLNRILPDPRIGSQILANSGGVWPAAQTGHESGTTH